MSNGIKKGMFPGSFDPPTFAHLDLIKRARALVDTLMVVVAVSPSKTPFLSQIERLELVNSLVSDLPGVEVIKCEGMVIDCAKMHGVDFFIRGVRSMADWPHEESLAEANRLLGGIETVWVMGDPKFRFLSSSLLREISLSGGAINDFVPPFVQSAIETQIRRLG